MSSNQKVICDLCETTVIKKNLKTHNSRRHPGEDLKWTSATSTDVRNLLFGHPQPEKRKICKTDKIGDILEATKRSRLEDVPKISNVDCSESEENGGISKATSASVDTKPFELENTPKITNTDDEYTKRDEAPPTNLQKILEAVKGKKIFLFFLLYYIHYFQSNDKRHVTFCVKLGQLRFFVI